MGKLLLALKGAGIDEKDFQTSRLSLQPQNAPNRTGPSAIVGYRASNRVTIRLARRRQTRNVIDTLVGAGANEIGGINFMVTAASKLLDQAREQGRRRCPPQGRDLCQGRRRHAWHPAQHLGRKFSGPTPYRRMSAGMAASAPVAQGEETLQVTVSVSWAIKPAGQ